MLATPGSRKRGLLPRSFHEAGAKSEAMLRPAWDPHRSKEGAYSVSPGTGLFVTETEST